MTSRRAVAPLTAAGLGLVGALAATLSLHHGAVSAVDAVLAERLAGAGQAAAALLTGATATREQLREVMIANGLDAVYILGRDLRVAADATGVAGRRADPLRVDAARVQATFAGRASAEPGYRLGTLTMMTGYFPIWSGGQVTNVLVVEAGQAFAAARTSIAQGRALALSLSLLCALGLAVAAVRWNRAERERQEAAVRAAQGTALSRVAAIAAHEIRNPLGVIRGTIELMRERSASTLKERDRVALGDIAGEVERLRRLTEDLVDLAADKPLSAAVTSIEDVIVDVARATEAMFPDISVCCELGLLPALEADPVRLRQVFANLLANAAQAQAKGKIFVRAAKHNGVLRVLIQDRGPGIPADVGDRVFDLYFTTESGGTGLGLAIARRLVERHGGTLAYLRDRGPGTTFEVSLPVNPRSAQAKDDDT